MAAGLLALLVLGCAAGSTPRTETGWYLGTTCAVSIYGHAPGGVFSRVFEMLQDVDVRMGVGKEGSEIDRVSEQGGPVAVSPSTYEVIAAGLRYGELTHGAFDITIGPLVKLWDIGGPSARVPSAQEIAAARALVDYREVSLDPVAHTVRLDRSGMSLDLGGIAKGYAADQAASILTESGVRRAIIDFGGNIYALGERAPKRRWRIGVQDPSKRRGEYLGIVEVTDRAVVTSGVYERFFEQGGVRYHHILDPATGSPAATGLLSVTIVARRSIDADALSTGVFVLGIDRGTALVESLEDVEAIFVTEDRKVSVTSGLGDVFRLTSSDYAMLAAPARK